MFGTLLMLSGCSQDLMEYEGKECIYFNAVHPNKNLDENMWPHEHFSFVSFGNLTVDETDLNVDIKATGAVKDFDRSFQVVVVQDSTTAVKDRDYTGLLDTYTIKAGQTSTQVQLKVKRTPEMDGDTLRLQLKLIPNQHFDVAFHNYEDDGFYEPEKHEKFGYNTDASVHNYFFYDVLSRPDTWQGGVNNNGQGTLGNFSAKKYRLLMEISGTTVKDWESKETMPSIRVKAIAEIASEYLLEQARKKEPVLDEDGTMMYLMHIGNISPSEAWAPFTKPEDYYKDKK